jgi:hypothetical protein
MASDPSRFFEPDSGGYLALATSLSSGDGFTVAGAPEFIRTPGYPGFLAVIQWVVGDSARVLALVQAVVTAVFVVPLRRLSGVLLPRRTANVVVVLMAVHPLILYHSTMLLTEALSLLLVMILAERLVRLLRAGNGRMVDWLIVGFVVAVLTHVRPIAYFLTPVLVVVVVFVLRRRRVDIPSILARVGCLALVPLLAIGGWQIRNKVEVDSWRFSGIEAVNMYLYRAAGVIGYQEGRDWLEVREDLRNDFGQPREGEEVGPYFDRMYGEGLDVLRSDLGATAVITARGLADTALGDSRDPDRFLSYFNLESRSLITWAMWIVMAMLWVAAALGVKRAREVGSGAAATVLAVIVVYMVVLSAGPEAYSRFRTPVEPLLWLLAAVGVIGLRERRKYPRQS